MFASPGALLLTTTLLGNAVFVRAQSWCGKNYLPNETVVPPGGQFPTPDTSSTPLLAFRCSPAIMPYLEDDSNGTIVVETLVTYSQIANTSPISSSGSSSSSLDVSVSISGQNVASASVPLNASAFEIPFSLSGLTPSTDAFDVQCSAQTGDGQSFSANSSLLRLPSRTDGGSVTKMDLRTGAMLVQDETTSEWETVFPIGFYTTYDGYLTTNLSAMPDLKSRGFTIVHPVPPFDNTTALNDVLDRMEEAGLYLMYDMRYTYMNSTAVTEQVNAIKTRKNLLVWYTGDEPDGPSDPFNASTGSYSLIKSLDGGGYHPVSLVLNCQDYYFQEYSQGADVVMQDSYPIAVNTSFSSVYDTACTEDFGCCGCDNCQGRFADIRDRMDEFYARLEVMGEKRTKTVWAVPQAFGGSQFWTRAPTGDEWLVEAVLSINHGATGIVPWIDPTPDDIKDSSTLLAQALPTIKTFLFDPSTNFTRPSSSSDDIDVGLWTTNGQTLVLAANLVNSSGIVNFGLGGGEDIQATELFNSGGVLGVDADGASGMVSFNAVGSLAYVLQTTQTREQTSGALSARVHWPWAWTWTWGGMVAATIAMA